MKDFFPESLGQKHGCALYMAKYSKSISFQFSNPLLMLHLKL